ncbi:hypothetical protein [Lysinibacillus sp. SGAir0095]|uniref:hypothetical protein n=1 Tax=Lysinibacillus sp. SGAir0095 TaxID=2070463 RepID=UPI0010CCD51F|nr:hypothetical protein [Lysinibacillus sp. SGAir0095]QCR32016.1 hypothetical protein C1N55_07455 [Lysinibacillus sp. SGAir0095]
MIEDLFELYDLLIKKERTMNDTLQIVSSVKGNQFLEEIIIRTEKLIVKSFGGQEVHWLEINQFTDAFFQYRQSFITKERLISIIKKIIG